MTHRTDILLTALAPAAWGSTYLVTSEYLPDGYPLTVAALRALPAGLLLVALTRRLPDPSWLGRIALLGAFNFAIFWGLLFVAAYRLPGGVAATLGSTQAMMVLLLARGLLGTPARAAQALAASLGVFGVALMVLQPGAALDPLGIAAGIGGSASMAAGTVLSRKWKPPVSPLVFTAWQLTAGGILLVPAALWLEPALPPLEPRHLGAMLWLGLVGAALTYALWFRGIARLEPAAVSILGLMSPVTAITLGWLVLGQALGPVQVAGVAVVLASVWLGQRAARPMAEALPLRGLCPARCRQG